MSEEKGMVGLAERWAAAKRDLDAKAEALGRAHAARNEAEAHLRRAESALAARAQGRGSFVVRMASEASVLSVSARKDGYQSFELLEIVGE
jgi:hypothetical protein